MCLNSLFILILKKIFVYNNNVINTKNSLYFTGPIIEPSIVNYSEIIDLLFSLYILTI